MLDISRLMYVFGPVFALIGAIIFGLLGRVLFRRKRYKGWQGLLIGSAFPLLSILLSLMIIVYDLSQTADYYVKNPSAYKTLPDVVAILSIIGVSLSMLVLIGVLIFGKRIPLAPEKTSSPSSPEPT